MVVLNKTTSPMVGQNSLRVARIILEASSLGNQVVNTFHGGGQLAILDTSLECLIDPPERDPLGGHPGPDCRG
jgi:hypothetical protein